MLNAIMIINLNSGKKHKKVNESRIIKIFNKYHYNVSIIYTEFKGHAKAIIESINTDLVVSVGGDGTFNEVMSGNFTRKNHLLIAHIPFGTANDIGAMYGYTSSFYRNIEILLNGKVKNVDICTINGKPFTYVAALGKFTNVSYETPRYLKKRFGYLAYLIEGMKELKNDTKLFDIKYVVDDVEYHGKYSCMLISNANRIAGINNFYNNIKLDDNKFEVLFCEMTTKKEVLKSLYSLKNGDISTLPGFKFYKASKLSIEFNQFLNKGWSIDGEELNDKKDKFNIEIVRNVKILIPKKNIKRLFLDKE